MEECRCTAILKQKRNRSVEKQTFTHLTDHTTPSSFSAQLPIPYSGVRRSPQEIMAWNASVGYCMTGADIPRLRCSTQIKEDGDYAESANRQSGRLHPAQ